MKYLSNMRELQFWTYTTWYVDMKQIWSRYVCLTKCTSKLIYKHVCVAIQATSSFVFFFFFFLLCLWCGAAGSSWSTMAPIQKGRLLANNESCYVLSHFKISNISFHFLYFSKLCLPFVNILLIFFYDIYIYIWRSSRQTCNFILKDLFFL